MAANILHSETLGYLKMRVYMVNLIFLEFLVMAVAYGLFAFAFKRWPDGNLDHKKQVTENDRNVAAAARTLGFMIVLAYLFFNYVLGGWCQQTLGRSLTEANDVLGGSRSELKAAQVL